MSISSKHTMHSAPSAGVACPPSAVAAAQPTMTCTHYCTHMRHHTGTERARAMHEANNSTCRRERAHVCPPCKRGGKTSAPRRSDAHPHTRLAHLLQQSRPSRPLSPRCGVRPAELNAGVRVTAARLACLQCYVNLVGRALLGREIQPCPARLLLRCILGLPVSAPGTSVCGAYAPVRRRRCVEGQRTWR